MQDVISERTPGGGAGGGKGNVGAGGGGGSRAKLASHAPLRSSAAVEDLWEGDTTVVDNDGRSLKSIDI
jgi:hypothetical protein